MGRKRGSEIFSNWIQLSEGSVILWDNKTTNNSGKGTQYGVRCGKCGETRLVYRTAILNCIRAERPFTGLCDNCTPRNPPRNTASLPGKQNPRFKGGRMVNQHGYLVLTLTSLEGRELEIAAHMAHSGGVLGPRRVSEHRLVMAVHLNRPLLSTEIVHHRNGIRTDNRLENLELLTSRHEHIHGHGDEVYQQEQEAIVNERTILVKEIDRLRALLTSHEIDPD